MIHKIKVAILRGGGGSEYNISLKSGSNILRNLSTEKYILYDVIISPKDIWYLNGVSVTPSNIFDMVDFVFNALDSGYSKGKIQKILNDFNIPYAGSDSFSSTVSINKNLTKKIYKDIGIKTPYFKLIEKAGYNEQVVFDVFKSVPMPCVAKPANTNSSTSIFIVSSLPELVEAIEKIFDISDIILIEEYIRGREVVCNIIEDFRDVRKYSMIPQEIVHNDKFIFSQNSKLENGFYELTSVNLSKNQKEEIQKIAIEVHNALNLKHYSSSDFIVHPKRGIYLLETNSAPMLHENSAFVKSLGAIGSDLEEFLDHIIKIVKK